MTNTHDLKCWPKHFAAVRHGDKTFEIRRNDRDFAVGDQILLREFDPESCAYTGQTETRLISYLLSEEAFGVVHGFVVIGFGPAPHLGDVAPAEGLTRDQLADWHATTAGNAALRAEEARKVSLQYQGLHMGVAADRHAGVAQAATDEAAFHAAAAAIVRGAAQAEAAEPQAA